MSTGSCSSKFPMRVSGVGVMAAEAEPGQISATSARTMIATTRRTLTTTRLHERYSFGPRPRRAPQIV